MLYFYALCNVHRDPLSLVLVPTREETAGDEEMVRSPWPHCVLVIMI